MQIIDLGNDDDGYVQITLLGNTVTVCPSEELDTINKNSEATSRKDGNDLMRVVQERVQALVKSQCDKDCNPSVNMSLAFWQTLIRLDKEIADSFSKRLGSHTTSDSTAEPQESETAGCADTSLASAA